MHSPIGEGVTIVRAVKTNACFGWLSVRFAFRCRIRGSFHWHDLHHGHEFLGAPGGDAGAPVTACAIYGACNADCNH